MGAVAAKSADRCWLTNDNPRTENPVEIVADIQRGLPRNAIFLIELDRARAIRAAIAAARAGDAVLVAGKGHEDYQIFGTGRQPFSDQAVVRAALGAWS
jgi:UDP-N-acetylmuramoyl-L-alanyl-D-glutamate--2,6-diaminopimelate ligase